MQSLGAGWLVGVFLLSVRLGALALMAPPLGGGLLPPSVRVALVLALAASLALPVPRGAGYATSLGWLFGAVLSEAALGAMMALGVNMAFAAFTIGGRLVDVQVGFGLGQVFDPMTRQQMPVIAAAFNQLALVGFFLFDGHHALLRGLTLSLEAVPPGSGWMLEAGLTALLRQAVQMFSLGFAMVAPVVVCLMLVELGLGVLSRNLPQMNALVVGVPIKIAVGLAVLVAWIGSSGSVMNRIYQSAFQAWEALWR